MNCGCEKGHRGGQRGGRRHADSCQCGCGQHHGCSCGCDRGFQAGPAFWTRDEKVAWLEQELEALQERVQAVQERIDALKGEV